MMMGQQVPMMMGQQQVPMMMGQQQPMMMGQQMPEQQYSIHEAQVVNGPQGMAWSGTERYVDAQQLAMRMGKGGNQMWWSTAKGKCTKGANGKGKGKDRTCWTCGSSNHLAAQCFKGVGKGC